MSKSGTPRMSAGVSSAMSEFWSAHSPITARPASVKPMNVAPPSPRKILARPGRKLYGRKPRHAPTNAADRYMRYRWPVWSAAMLMKMPAITPRPAASPSIPSRNWTALVTVTNAVQFLDGDRKSTRLNSSHSQISYAVFCLKKKNPQDSVDHVLHKIDAFIHPHPHSYRKLLSPLT